MLERSQDYSFSEVGRRLRISKGAVSKIVKQYNLTGSTAPKTLNHVRTVQSVLSKTLFCWRPWCKQVVCPLSKNCTMI